MEATPLAGIRCSDVVAGGRAVDEDEAGLNLSGEATIEARTETASYLFEIEISKPRFFLWTTGMRGTGAARIG